MALFLNDKEHRSELQNKVAAELNERLKQQGAIEYEKPEPSILEDQHTTRPAGVILVILVIIAIAFLLYLLRP